MLSYLLIYCRSGFEPEASAEITARAADSGFYGYPSFEPKQGFIVFNLQPPSDALELIKSLRFKSLIFARQWVACTALLENMSTKDRVTPLAELVQQLPECAELRAETPDTTEGRNLNSFAKKFGSAASGALRNQGLLLPRTTKLNWRLHLLVLSSQSFWVGVSPINNSSEWDQGIKRLKLPADAPSRSTLKLEEAWHTFIPRRFWNDKLEGGLKAVDLGAAPGGWTYQLVKQGMFVIAVDNGAMDERLMDSGQVEHKLEDAFTFVPAKRVDMLVCDVVDKPARIVELMAKWAVNRWARILIFNLKLPMKRRFAEVEQRLEWLEGTLTQAEVKYQLEARHLYHDREEITCFLELS